MSDESRVRLTIIYKSGATIDITCKNFTVRKQAGELVEVEWAEPSPRPMYFGVDQVAAIWEHLEEEPAE